jgi:hypothetical protein
MVPLSTLSPVPGRSPKSNPINLWVKKNKERKKKGGEKTKKK